MKETIATKKQNLFYILCGIFITNAIVAEVIGAKIFSVSDLFGFGPESGFLSNVNMSAGVINWPIVFITSDIINEYFGRKGVRKVSYMTAALIAYSFFVIYAATALPPAQFWLDLNKEQGNINTAFNSIFRQGMGIIVGSIAAFLIGQILDSLVFHRLRVATNNRFIWIRVTISTLVSQLVDSFIVIFIAFYIFGKFSLEQVLAVGLTNYIYKSILAVGMTPLVYLAHNIINKYLGKEASKQIIDEATHSEE
jgi:uncharacterized integral membrane protein (TIGR00697 family)